VPLDAGFEFLSAFFFPNASFSESRMLSSRLPDVGAAEGLVFRF
jgi:hypothetical protein